MDLGVTIMAGGYHIRCFRNCNLIKLYCAIDAALFWKTRLQKTTPTPTAKILGAAGCHIDKILFANDGFEYRAQILGSSLSKGFAD